jgi:hypothetical protein
MSMGPEVKAINWKQARGALYRWPQVLREWPDRAFSPYMILTQP